MVSKSVLKRLALTEEKLALRFPDIEEEKRIADLNTLLQMYDYFRKKMELSMTPEEIQRDNEETSKQIVVRYDAYLALSLEEQKRQNEISDLELTKELEQFRVWLDSNERRQFDKEYTEFKRLQDPSLLGETL